MSVGAVWCTRLPPWEKIVTRSGRCIVGPCVLYPNQARCLDLDAKYSLSQENMSCSRINIHIHRLTRRNHVTIFKLHGVGTLSSQFSTDNHESITPHAFAPLTMINLSDLECALDSKHYIVSLLCIQLHSIFFRIEFLLDNWCQLLLILLPFSLVSGVWVALMMTSVLIGVILTSTPEFPCSANSRVNT